MRRITSPGVLGIVLALLVAACGGGDPTATPAPRPTATPAPRPTATPAPQPTASPTATGIQPRRGGTVRVHSTSAPEPVFLLGSAATMTGANQHLAGVVNQLVEYDPETADPLDIRPDLAERWTFSTDGRVLTFKIRQGVRFHSGEPLTMADIRFSLTSKLAPTRSEFDTVKEATKGVVTNQAKRVADYIGDWARDVTALDENTLEFKLNRPGGQFLNLFGINTFHILQRSVVEKGKLHAFANPETLIGTGPYKFANYNRDVSSRWERNNQYWKPGTPYLDAIEMFIIREPSRIAAAYKTGQLQLTGLNTAGLALGDAKQLQKDLGDRAKVYFTGPSFVTGLIMNAGKKPWDDPRSRKAMSLVIDRQAMINILGEGEYVIGTPLPCGFSWTFSCEDALKMPGSRQLDGKKHPEDIALAQSLFKEVGLGPGSQVEIGCRDSGTQCQEAVILKQQLENHLGWKVTVNAVETSVGSQMMDTRGYKDIFIAPYSASPPIPDVSLGNHGKGNEDHTLRTGYYNEKAHAVLTELVATQDVAKQRELALRANNLLLEDTVHPFFFFVQAGFIVNNAIQGVHPPAIFLTYMKWDHIWCDKC